MSLRRLILCVVVAFAPGAAQADTFYVANLNGAQMVPPTASPGTAFGRVRLNESETQISISLYFSALPSTADVAHLHGPASPGATAPVFAIIALPPTTGGATINLPVNVSPANVATLKAGQYYLDIHTVSPGGDIRGQATLDPVFAGTLSGAQQFPANGSAGTGRAWVSLVAGETRAMVTATWSGLGSNTVDSHLHAGLPGTNGPIVCDFATVTGAPSGANNDQHCALDPAQIAQLKRGGLYFDVHSEGLPDGELRAQITRTWNPCDFDGDSKSDHVIIRNTGASVDWWVRLSSGGIQTFPWGTPADYTSSARFLCPDVDGDGVADATIWRPGAAAVFWSRLSTGGIRSQVWGTTGDDPRVTGDYDGDGRDDYAVYRENPAGSTYWIVQSTTGTPRTEPWGATSDARQTVPDYDGDGKADFGVQRFTAPLGAVYWRRFSSTGSFDAVFWGNFSDFQQSADYDGDGRTDIALTRTNGLFLQWFIRGSLTGTVVAPYGNGFFFGTGDDFRVGADYDGDRRADIATWRNAIGTWFVQSVTTGLTIVLWGAPGDRAVQVAYWQ